MEENLEGFRDTYDADNQQGTRQNNLSRIRRMLGKVKDTIFNQLSKIEKIFILISKVIRKLIMIKAQKVKEYFILKYEYLDSYIRKEDVSEYNYEDLAPKDNIDKNDTYFKTLDWAIKNKNINNIALTGSYGSGKSSIIRTYERKRLNHKYLNISLASFHEFSDSEEDNQLIEEEQYEIEKGILQQLFYKVDSKKIPYTRFRKIRNIKNKHIIKTVAIILITLILGMIIFIPDIIEDMNNNWDKLNEIFGNEFLAKAIYICFTILVIYNIVILFKQFNSRLKVSSLSFENAAVEEKTVEDESIFNKYLDEILYFFETTKYSVVIFEDLDRFDNTKIFIKLRELNLLLNNYEKIKRKIVFVYAIKDDMFKGTERTKFFDFIIPVIPVINSSNSGEKLLEKVKKDNLLGEISQEFINGVSVYIDDMRMLNNIYNEFIFYRNILSDSSLKIKQILALVIYKNLYPEDFAKIQYNDGLVYSAFNNKRKIIAEKIVDIKNKIDEGNSKFQDINKEHLQSIKELKIVFICENINLNEIRVEWIGKDYNDKYEVNDILKDDFDMNKLLKNNKLVIKTLYGRVYEITPQQIKEYKRRFEILELMHTQKQEKLKEKLEKLKEKEQFLKSYSLKKLIEEYGAKEVLEEGLYRKKGIVYLLRNGYINESYINYLSYFYEGSLTKGDMDFILSIRNYEGKEFNYELVKMEQIISKLNINDFKQKEVLNFKLFEFILNNKDRYKEQLDNFMKQIVNLEESIIFIDEFKDYIFDEVIKKEFWNILCKKCDKLWNYIKSGSNFPNSKMDIYLKNIIEYVDIDLIESLNGNGDFVSYIQDNEKFMAIVSDIDILKVKKVISQLNIKFNIIDIHQRSEELLNYIWDGCYYNFNEKIIEDILLNKCNKDINEIKTANYTEIRNSNYDKLIDYVENNKEEYIEKVFLKIDTNNNEKVEYILELLNCSEEQLSTSSKISMLCKEEFELEDIKRVPQNLWSSMLENKRINISWDNVIEYYKSVNKFDDALIEFLNREEVYIILSETSYSSNEDDENSTNTFVEEFTNKLISCAELTDSFNELAKSIPWEYNDLNGLSISGEHMDILIEYAIVKFNDSTYKFIRNNYEDKYMKFIKGNLEEYIKNIDKCEVNSEDLRNILILPECVINHKKSILESKTFKDKLDENLAELTVEIITENAKQIELEVSIYWSIFNIISDDKKLLLLIDQAHNLKFEMIAQSLKGLGEEFDNINGSRTRQKIRYSDEILNLAIELEKCSYISSYNIDTYEEDVKFIQFNATQKK